MKRTIIERTRHALEAEYISLDDGSLLLNVSKATLRRRILLLTGCDDVLRHQRIVRVRREALMRLFGHKPRPQ